MIIMKKTFNVVIRQLRKEKGWTQPQLGEMLNISPQGIHKWEQDSIPDAEMLIKVAKLFDVSVDYLLGVEEQRIKSLESYLDAAEDLMRRGDYIRAVEGLEEAAKRFPNDEYIIKEKTAVALMGTVRQYDVLYHQAEENNYYYQSEESAKAFDEPLIPGEDCEIVSKERKAEIQREYYDRMEKNSPENIKAVYARAAEILEELIRSRKGDTKLYLDLFIKCCTEADRLAYAKGVVERYSTPMMECRELRIGCFSNDRKDKLNAMTLAVGIFFEMSDGLRISGSESKEELISLKETDLASLAFLNTLSAGDNKGLLKHICPLLIRLFCTCAYLNEEDDAKEYYEQLQGLRETDSKAVHDALHKSLQQLISLSYKNDLSNELSEMNASLMIINDNK